MKMKKKPENLFKLLYFQFTSHCFRTQHQSLSSTNEMRGFFLDHLFSTKSDISVMSFEK